MQEPLDGFLLGKEKNNYARKPVPDRVSLSLLIVSGGYVKDHI